MRETGGILPYRRNALLISLALGIATLVIVPAYNTFIADAAVLSLPGYVGPACRYPVQFFPQPICPYLVAGESPATICLALVVIPATLIAPSRKPHYAAALIAALWAVVQVLAPFWAAFPSALGGRSIPSPFLRNPGCGLVLCGLDHTLFHLVQFVVLLAIALVIFRGARTRHQHTN